MPSTAPANAPPSHLEIARSYQLRPILDVASELGLLPEEVEPYGRYKAKITLAVRDRLQDRPLGKYIDVTAITPTPLGEGKTVTSIGLGQAFRRMGVKAITCLRQPSLGPVFGIKGGANGGGHAQIAPMEDVNLHLTGDIHAVGAAHNLLAAMVDNHLHHGNALDIDPESIQWRRVVDISDRVLRNVTVGLGGKADGPMRQSGFDITVASEVMAILALATDLRDLRQRLGRIVVATNRAGAPVTADDLKAAGAMTVLLRDAIKPTLIQNLEGGAVFVHAGPFANIAQGNSSIVADQIALRLADFVVTESGFGADLGAEKFMDIKCRTSGLAPDCVVIVATVRALKMHSGRFTIVAGKPLDPGLLNEDLDALADGIVNLEKHILNVRLFGVPVVVGVNAFETDTEREHAFIRERAMAAGAHAAVTHRVYAEGGAGGEALARAVMAACREPADFITLYPDEASIAEKIETIATRIYGADGVDYSPEAAEQLALYERLGYGHLPICVAKTHLSISHDPKLKGAPTGWRLPIREMRVAAGAGFIYPICGEMRTMPGLPSVPAAVHIDIDEHGEVVGLF
jgi:formate--tetrahydrofolate ligase